MAFPDRGGPKRAGMSTSARILVVDDDAATRAMIRFHLESAGHRVLEASDGARGLVTAKAEKPALVILDLMMPELDGLSLAGELRRLGATVPILMLTTRVEIEDRVSGLQAGADDYLGKPFDGRELLARVQALLRRSEREAASCRILKFDEIDVDLENQQATRKGEPFPLTRTEFALLSIMAKHLGSPVSRELMLDEVWGYTYYPTTRTVDTHIWRLRKKLGDNADAPRWIRRSQGNGYLLTCPVG